MARYKEQIGDIAVFYIRKDGEIDYHVHTFKGTLWDESKRIGIRGQVFHGREELNKYLDKIRKSQSELQSKEIEFLNKKKKNIKILNTRQIKSFIHKANNVIFELYIPHDGETTSVQIDGSSPSVIEKIMIEIQKYRDRIDNEVYFDEVNIDDESVSENFITIKFE